MSAKIQKIQTPCHCYLVSKFDNKMSTRHVFKFRINPTGLFSANPTSVIKVALDAQSQHIDYGKKTIQGRGIKITSGGYQFMHFGGTSSGSSDVIYATSYPRGEGLVNFEITVTSTTATVVVKDSDGAVLSNEVKSMSAVSWQNSETVSAVLIYLDANNAGSFVIDKIDNVVI